MNLFLILLCASPFVALLVWGIVRLVRWVLVYVAWWSSE